MQPIAVFLFEHSTRSAQPWADAGYLCYCVDIQHPAGEHRSGNIIRVGADLLTWELPAGPIAFVAAFPPCTHLSGSGARWWEAKGEDAYGEALMLTGRALMLIGQARRSAGGAMPWMLENPTGRLSASLGKERFAFNPSQYAAYLPAAERAAEAYTKRTCIWAGGGFRVPEPRPVRPELGSKMHRLPPGPDRANLRSETPRGFALAVFRANAQLQPA